MTIKSLGFGTLLAVLTLPVLGAGCQTAHAQEGQEAAAARPSKKAKESRKTTAQAQLAYLVGVELYANFGKKGLYKLKEIESRPALVRYLKKSAKACKTNCKGLAYLAKAADAPKAQRKFTAVKGKHYGLALLEAAETWDAQAQSDEGDGEGDGGTPPGGDDGGNPPGGDDGGTPPGGDEGGGEEPPVDDTSPFECLSWWGEHIGSSSDENGGLPETSFPPAAPDPTGGCFPLGDCPLP